MNKKVHTDPDAQPSLERPATKPKTTKTEDIPLTKETTAQEERMKQKVKGAPMGNIFQTGIASWYGGKFQGRRTANGEIYDMYKLTAAHKTLPFHSIVEVENLDNGKRIRVRINDRGPFVKDRIIDLSYKAAKRIGSDANGIAPVTLRLVNGSSITQLPPRTSGPPAHKIEKIVEQELRDTKRNNTKQSPPTPRTNPRTTAPTPNQNTNGSYFLQAGAFGERANAEKMLKNINIILSATPFKILTENGLHKVISSPLPSRKKAENLKKILLDIDIDAFIKEI